MNNYKLVSKKNIVEGSYASIEEAWDNMSLELIDYLGSKATLSVEETHYGIKQWVICKKGNIKIDSAALLAMMKSIAIRQAWDELEKSL